MVKVIITKLVKLKVILVHLQRWIFKIFKIFFNHGEGNENEISQIESYSGACSEMFLKLSSTMVKVILKWLVKLRVILEHLRICIFKIFFNHGEGNDDEIGQIEGNFSASFRVKFQTSKFLWDTNSLDSSGNKTSLPKFLWNRNW